MYFIIFLSYIFIIYSSVCFWVDMGGSFWAILEYVLHIPMFYVIELDDGKILTGNPY